MTHTINIRKSSGHPVQSTYDREPDVCPICHKGIHPLNPECASLVADDTVLERVLRCPLQLCNHFFIARYTTALHDALYRLDDCVPTELRDLQWDELLEDISPDFCDIFNEAHKTQQLGLSLISGPGYRKALEFLIKDYLVGLQSTNDAKKEIENLALMPCIRKYVTDPRVRTTAERAAWLGNDEVHYVRKWEDKDLQDLKDLIQLTCYWIQSEHLTKAVAVAMPQGKK